MDDIEAFYRRFSPHSAIVIAFFCPFVPPKVFLLSSTLTLYELLIGCRAFIYFSILTAERFSSYIILEAGLKIHHIQVVVNLP